jgi:hypothetical protein
VYALSIIDSENGTVTLECRLFIFFEEGSVKKMHWLSIAYIFGEKELRIRASFFNWDGFFSLNLICMGAESWP